MKRNNKATITFITISIVSIILVIAIVIYTMSKKDDFFLTTIPKSYCYVTDNKKEKEVEAFLYVTNKNSFVTDISKCNSSYIQSRNRLDKIKVDLHSINDLNIKTTINHKNYYLYSYVFKLPQIEATEYDLLINDAMLLLDFVNNEIEIDLGSFYFYKIPYYGDNNDIVSVSKLKGIINYVEGNKSLVGLVLGLHNNYHKMIKIKDIEILDKSVKVSMNEIKEVSRDIESSENISSILGYDYDVYLDSNELGKTKELELSPSEVVNYIVPIKYLYKYIINSVSFKITYAIDGHDYYYYSDDIKLFTDFNMVIDEGLLKELSYSG